MSLPHTTTALRSFLAISVAVHAAVLGMQLSTELNIPAHLGLLSLSTRLLPASESDEQNQQARDARESDHERGTEPPQNEGPQPATASRKTPTAGPVSEAVQDDQANASAQPASARVNHLLGELQTELSRYLTYPPVARKHGWEGEVVLRVTLTQDGRLADVQLAGSSGYDVLDRATLAALTRIERLPGLAGGVERGPLVLRLPITYQLSGMRYGTPTIQDLHPDRRLGDHRPG